MTTQILTAPRPDVTGGTLKLRQLASVMRIEMKKSLFAKRALPVYVLAALPLVLFVLHVDGAVVANNMQAARETYATVYSIFILGAVVFFGSALVFSNLFRGEMLQRSLHYYLLTPVRREVLVTAKYCTGLITAITLFGTTTVLAYLALYLPVGFNQLADDLINGPALAQLSRYLLITVLGCTGYGALFLLFGALFRNPVLPIVGLLGWELLHFILPPALKAISVTHYLKGLIPVPLSEGPLAIVTSPPPLWLSVCAIVILSAAALTATTAVLRRTEIHYSDD